MARGSDRVYKMTDRRPLWRSRRLRWYIVILVGLVVALPVVIGFTTTYGMLYVPCGGALTTPSVDFEWFTIDARTSGHFNGYMVLGTNGATVIFPPNFRANLGSRLKEAEVLLRHGYSIVLFESRACAGMGPTSLGYEEVNEVRDVLDYLQLRGDVDMTRIGIHGFSSAGATAIMAAARYPELRAVLAEGGYADIGGLFRDYNRDSTFLFDIYRWSVRGTYRLLIGNSIDNLSPINVIDQIAPRPLFLIYGTEESSLAGGRRQFEAAGSNATLWVLAGADHGQYINVAPQEYEERVVAFFDQALLNGH